MTNLFYKNFTILLTLFCFFLTNSHCSAETIVIQDELATELQTQNLSLPQYQYIPINDFLITDDFVKNSESLPKSQQIATDDFLVTKDFVSQNSFTFPTKRIYYRDRFAERTLKKYKNIVYVQKKYDFQNIHHTMIKVRPIKEISTKQAINAGDRVYFSVEEDVKKEGKIIAKKGEKITARVEIISESGLYGIPADIIVGNFSLNGIPLSGEIEKEGFTHTYWIIPVANVASFFIPFSGQIFRFVHGGHAKIKTKETFELQFPDNILK